MNADSDLDDISRELRAFLDYVAGKRTEDSYVKKLDEAVKRAKRNREWRHEYMTLLMRDQENIEKGIQKGIQKGRTEGEDMMIALIQKLVENGRVNEIDKMKENREYRQSLYREYDILAE